MLSAIMMSVVMLSFVMLSVIRLSVVMLSVVTPFIKRNKQACLRRTLVNYGRKKVL
jgi:hypothetical protein